MRRDGGCDTDEHRGGGGEVEYGEEGGGTLGGLVTMVYVPRVGREDLI